MFLVTTAEKINWEENNKILFLGDWCLINQSENINQKLDFEIMPYHWDSSQKIYEDSIYIKNIYEILLSELSKSLNKYHSYNWSKRQWRILIGPWLYKFLVIILDRWRLISKAGNKYQISNTYVSFNSINSIYTCSYAELSDKCKTTNWNKKLFDLIIIEQNKIPFKIRKLILAKSSKTSQKRLSFKSKLKSFLKDSLLRYLCNLTNKENEISFVNSYISLKDILKIKFCIKDFPSYEFTPKISSFEESSKGYRGNLLNLKNSNDDFYNFCIKILPDLLPNIYLEDIKKLDYYSKKSSLIPNPKVIVTGISQWHDEIFKFWSAKQISNKAKLFIVQHGGNYGIDLFNTFEEHERKISDKYLVWGWGKNNKKYINIPVSIVPKKGIKKIKLNENILIIANAFSSRYFTSQLHPIIIKPNIKNNYEKKLEIGLKKLSTNINSKIILRTYPGHIYVPQEILNLEKTNKIKLSKNKKIRNDICKSKLVICSYLGSTFIECIYMDFPCLLLIDNEFNPLRKELNLFIKKLIDVNICHESYSSLVKHVKKIESDVFSWWTHPEVALAKEIFASKFAKKDGSISQEILNLL